MPKLFKTEKKFLGVEVIEAEIQILRSRLGSGYNFTILMTQYSYDTFVNDYFVDDIILTKDKNKMTFNLDQKEYRPIIVDGLPTDFLIAVEEKREAS